MSIVPSREEALFSDALAQPAAERAGFLAKACGADFDLLARLVALVAAHERKDSLGDAAPTTASTYQEKPSDTIGHYKLLQKLGEGGCGVVWMAEQEEPVRRRVALKVIKLGMDTKSVVARFEAERQALAMMDHPNIAKVFDAGATETGRPYFVMELVRGVPITKYCDENHLTPAVRLELFVKVCQAVQHAHHKGIIHRDIKPSNILVTVNDGTPTPKVIDFGIAKATQGKLTDATVFTAFEQFIGTPVYMSPEQAEMSSLDIDTRSDIYSLGVLLYELLTGRPPFDAREFAQAGLDQIRRQIREVEPARPSARLSTLNQEERTTIARLRGTAAANLSIMLRGDLDWIVMRCIEKDRTRRYDTANGLAEDIQRYLRSEPVVARPPSALYLLSKLVRRHRLAAAATAVVLALWLVGSGVSTYMATRAIRAEAAAEADRVALRYAVMFVDKLFRTVDVFPHLRDEWEGPDITIRQALARTSKSLEANDDYFYLRGERNRGEIADLVARIHYRLGDYPQAIAHLETALRLQRAAYGENDDRTLETRTWLAAALQESGRAAEAVAILEDVYRLRLRRDGPRAGDTLEAQTALGFANIAAGRIESGLKLVEAALEGTRAVHGEDDVRTLEARGSLAWANHNAGRFDAAIALDETTLKRQRTHFAYGKNRANPGLLWSLERLARSYRAAGRLDEAIAVSSEAVKLRRSRSGLTLDLFMAIDRFAQLLHKAGRSSEAIGTAQEAVALSRKAFGAEHRHTDWAALRLAALFNAAGRFAEAEPLARDVLTRQPQHARALLIAGQSIAGQKKLPQAEPLLLAAYAGLTQPEGDKSAEHRARTRDAVTALIELYQSTAQPAKVEEWQAILRQLDTPRTGRSP